MAINDVLPLKAARRDAIANLKCFGASDTRDLISIVTFKFTMRCHLIRLASMFGWVRFPCATRKKQMQNLRRVGEVYEIFRICGKPMCFPTPFSDYLCRVSFRRYSPLSLEVVEKRRKCKRIVAPNFCRKDNCDFSTAVC